MVFGGCHVSLESQITLSDNEIAIKQAVEMHIFMNYLLCFFLVFFF